MKANNVSINDEYYSKSKKADWVVVTMEANEYARGAYSDLMDNNIDIDKFNEIVDDMTNIKITIHHFGNNKKMSDIFIKGFHVGQGFYGERTSIVPLYLHKEFIQAIS